MSDNINNEAIPLTALEPIETLASMTKVQQQASAIFGGLKPVVAVHVNTIKQYCKATAPNVPLTPEQGASWHQKLYSALMAILNMKDISDMAAGMDRVLELFAEHKKGALNFTYTQRFIDVWVVTDKVRDLYTSLCNIFCTFADKEKRERIGKRLDLKSDGGTLRNMDYMTRERLVNYLYLYANK